MTYTVSKTVEVWLLNGDLSNDYFTLTYDADCGGGSTEEPDDDDDDDNDAFFSFLEKVIELLCFSKDTEVTILDNGVEHIRQLEALKVGDMI